MNSGRFENKMVGVVNESGTDLPSQYSCVGSNANEKRVLSKHLAP